MRPTAPPSKPYAAIIAVVPRLPQARAGETLIVRQRPLPFSFFPVMPGQGGARVADPLFATTPWGVMEAAITSALPRAAAQGEARAFLHQGRDFYRAARDQIAANPLLYYYAFLNVGKALLLVRGTPGPLAKARHGLSEQHTGTGADPRDSRLEVIAPGNGLNVFTELTTRLGFVAPPVGHRYDVIDLLPQVVIGHRLWREATRRAERFVGLDELEVVRQESTKEIWLRLYVSRDSLSRYGITHKRLLDESGLRSRFAEVVSPRGPEVICLEQSSPGGYTLRPTDSVMQLVTPTREVLARIVTSDPPYRKYYLYLDAQGNRVPQIATLWLLFFYLGSIVRYRPHLFAGLASGPYGAFVADFISAQPEQMLYLLASEMCQREVAKPAII